MNINNYLTKYTIVGLPQIYNNCVFKLIGYQGSYQNKSYIQKFKLKMYYPRSNGFNIPIEGVVQIKQKQVQTTNNGQGQVYYSKCKHYPEHTIKFEQLDDMWAPKHMTAKQRIPYRLGSLKQVSFSVGREASVDTQQSDLIYDISTGRKSLFCRY